jgi:hypothetical protein
VKDWRLQRCGVGLVPDARRLQRILRRAREVRDLHRAARDARILRAPGEIGVGLRRQAGAAALQGDLAEQHLVEDWFGQLELRQIRRRLARAMRGCRRRIVVIVIVDVGLRKRGAR